LFLISKWRVYLNLYSAVYSGFNPFDDFYPEAKCITLKEKDSRFNGPGILIVWGGGDIHPSLYNRPNYASSTGEKPSHRDEVEVYLVARAIEESVPIIGVCRGAQLGCAAAGGILIQDVDGHTSSHHIKTEDGRTFISSSLHHQMMFPWETDHKLLAWSAPARSKQLIGITEEEAKSIPIIEDQYVEPEVIWFSKIKCLAIQGHPEFMESSHPFNQYVKELCDHYLFST